MRKVLVGVIVLVVLVGAILGLRHSGQAPAEPAMTPTPTIREDGPRASGMRRGRVRVMKIERGELRLEGQVVDDQEKPVGGATVTLGHARETITEGDGSFAFDQLAEGDYELTAETQDAYTEDRHAKLHAASEPVTLALRRGAQLVVHVVDVATRAPIAGATVETTDRSGVTDESGTVTLRAIDSGYPSLVVTAEGRQSVSSWVAADASPAKTVERTIELARAAPVSGIVIDAVGKPVAKAIVRVEAGGAVWSQQVKTDANGQWTIATLGAGRHSARATSDIHLAMPDVAFESDGVHPTTGVVVRVELGARITGVLVDVAGRPVAGVFVHGGGNGYRTGPDGRFVLEGIVEGDHDVSARSETGAAADVPVKLARGGAAEVRLVFHESKISGVAIDARGKPVANASVTISNVKTGNGYTASADDYGKFDFGGVELGEYTITAHHDGVTEYGDRVPVQVPSGNRNVRVVVPDVATLRGRVMLDGKPVTEFGMVVSEYADATWSLPTVVRSADGRFSRADIGAGTVVLMIGGPGFERREIANVVVVPGKTTDLGDIAVERGRAITGRVVDARGLPVAGAMVSIVAHGTSRYEPDDETLKRRLAEPFARTDAAGRYTIVGVNPAKRDELRIEATHASGMALGRPLTSDVIDLVLAPVGILEGTIANYNDKQLHALAVSVADPAIRFQADLDRAGGFRFARLPSGDYHVRIRGNNTLPTQRITVTGGRSTIAFALPAESLVLTIRAAGCRAVALHDLVTGDDFGLAECKAGAGELAFVSPGRYRACVDLGDDCVTIDVPAAPQRQTIVIR